MDTKNIAKKAKTIKLNSSSKNTFFLIHGYTGSPTDFNELGDYLHNKFDANVLIPRIVGHGTQISDLDKLNYEDFLKDVEKELKKEIDKGNNIIIGGISLGGLLAIDLASTYNLKGILNVSTSYNFKFPVNIIRHVIPLLPIKYTKKPDFNLKKRIKLGAYTYPLTHLRGFKVVSQAKKRVNEVIKNITAPCLFIHYKKDNVIDYKGDKIILSMISSKIKKNIVFPSNGEKEHNIFYSSYHQKIYKILGDFVEENRLLI